MLIYGVLRREQKLHRNSRIDASVYNKVEITDNKEWLKLDDAKFIERLTLERDYDGLKIVNGDFAGAVCEDDRIILFRDHLGIKPLYYYCDEKMLAFSSDIRYLCATKGVNLSVNERFLYLLMSGGNPLSQSETEFCNIHCVIPGTWCEVRKTEKGFDITEHTYWRPGEKKIQLRNIAEYKAELRHLVEDAIDKRLALFSGTVGAELSGGLDSGVIDILISRMGRSVKFVSWSMPFYEKPEQSVDERRVVEDICKQEHTFCQYLAKEDRVDVDVFKELYITADTQELGYTAKVMNEQGIAVVFSGHGGDEGVSHRCNILELWCHHEYASFLREIYISTKGKKMRLLRTIKRTYRYLTKVLPKLKCGWRNKGADISSYMNRDFVAKMELKVKRPALFFPFDPISYVNMGGVRPRLENAAFQAGRYGVQYVFPYLDYRVIDFALSIPRHMYLQDGVDRYIFRETFKDIMPESLLKVDYKDFPSLRDNDYSKQGENIKSEFAQKRWAKECIEKFDRQRWGRYFDFIKCEKLLSTSPEQLNKTEQERQFNLLSYLGKILLIQNMQDNAEAWGEEQGIDKMFAEY